MEQPETIPSKPEFYTPAEIATIFRVKEFTVRLWLQRKLLRGVKIGGVWRVPREAVEEFR